MRDWWDAGDRWRSELATVQHGDVLRATAAFAAGEAITPNTLRGYRAAAEFVERLHEQGAVDQAGKHLLTRLPVKTISALQRTSRYGDAQLAGLLAAVLAEPGMPIATLLAREAEVRRGAAAAAPEANANAHSYRLRSRAFRAGALAALAAADGSRTVAVRPPTRLDPFVVDAVAAVEGGYRGVRLVARTAGTVVRPRLAEAFLQALAAARAFEAVILLTEASADADDLAARIARLGACGVGASWFDPRTGGIEVRGEPERRGDPDLASGYADLLAAFLAVPPEPGTGDAG